MPFSEKHTNVLSILTLILLVALLVYAGNLSPRGAHASTPHRKTSESVAEMAAVTPLPSEGETLRPVIESHDAGLAVAPEAPDDIMRALMGCITRACPAWTPPSRSGDAGR